MAAAKIVEIDLGTGTPSQHLGSEGKPKPLEDLREDRLRLRPEVAGVDQEVRYVVAEAPLDL